MTDTALIVFVLVAVVAIILLIAFLRRKPGGTASPGTADTLASEHADPPIAPLETAPIASAIMPIPAAAPQSLAASAPLASEEPAAHVPVAKEEASVPIDLSGALAENDDPDGAISPASPAPAPVETLSGGSEPITITTPAIPAATPVEADGDNLLRLKGVGPKIAALLKAEGVTRYAQIAGWSDADIAAIDAKLGSFAGRPRRDNWVDQAQLLAAGDVAGYEAKYGKL
jgi:predicted flap endonuclease-1-like 5' DNA nuclease